MGWKRTLEREKKLEINEKKPCSLFVVHSISLMPYELVNLNFYFEKTI